jgi:hypothetical protein
LRPEGKGVMNHAPTQEQIEENVKSSSPRRRDTPTGEMHAPTARVIEAEEPQSKCCHSLTTSMDTM